MRNCKENFKLQRNLWHVQKFWRNFEEINDNDDPIPPILKKEVNSILKKLKSERATGPDKISNKVLKTFVQEITPTLTVIFNEIIKRERSHPQWKKTEIILLHKKGNWDNISIYRSVSLISNVRKAFSKLLKYRLYNDLDQAQGKELAGFRKNIQLV